MSINLLRLQHFPSTKILFFKLKNFLLNSKNSYRVSKKLKTRKLDNVLLRNRSIKNCLLKIDVEGLEINVLRGAKNFIKKKTKFILVENHFFQLYQNKKKTSVDIFLKKNSFVLLKKFTFPSMHFQDLLYIKEAK